MPRSFTILLLLFLLSATTSQAALTPGHLRSIEAWLAKPVAERPSIESLDLPEGLTKTQADKATEQIWSLIQKQPIAEDSPLGPLPKSVRESVTNGRLDIKAQALPLGEHTMPFVVLRRERSKPPQAGRPLFFCLHGGGAHPPAKGPHSWPVNTREMQAQVQLSLGVYPSEGIYWIPRMADDRLGRWFHYHNQVAIDQVIDHAIMYWGVDPNRIYLLGISEGGYGTDILAPFMPDRFAGAAAMAAGVGLGNPAANLRNVAFSTDVGEKDEMFERRGLAEKFHAELDRLHEEDADGYEHRINVQKGRGHGIDYAPGPKWIAKHQRNPFPKKFVWIDQPLHNHRRERMYWVEFANEREGRNRIVGTADRGANRLELTAEQLSAETPAGYPTHIQATAEQVQPLSGAKLTLLIADELVNLDEPIEIVVNGKSRKAKLSRTAAAILGSLADRPDPTMVASCRLEVGID